MLEVIKHIQYLENPPKAPPAKAVRESDFR